MSDPADDLKRLNAEMDARLKNVLEQASPEFRASFAQGSNASARAGNETATLREVAVAAQRAATDLEAARAKTDAAFAELQKVKESRKVPLWSGVLVVVAFFALLVWLVATHP